MSEYEMKSEKPKYYKLNPQNLVKCFRCETLFLFGQDTENTNFRWCLGVGVVTKIKKGKDFDLLYINFGRSYSREIIVKDNHSRRQLLTLKVNQLATFRGKFKVYKEKNTGELKSVFYAYGLQAWYLPKAIDIKDLDIDESMYEQTTEEEEKSLLTFIDDITRKGDK